MFPTFSFPYISHTYTIYWKEVNNITKAEGKTAEDGTNRVNSLLLYINPRIHVKILLQKKRIQTIECGKKQTKEKREKY